MVVLGAETQAELCTKLKGVKVGGDNFLPWFARKSQTEFSHTAKAKVAIVATNDSDLKDKLIQAASLIEGTDKTQLQTPTGIYYSLNAEAGEVIYLPGPRFSVPEHGRRTSHAMA